MARAKTDAVLAAAVEPARRELLEATKGEGVGEHVGFTLDADRLGTHWFAATLPGYGGWHWAVTVTRAPRAKSATVCETQLLPGDDALLSPEWLPWADRLAPVLTGAPPAAAPSGKRAIRSPRRARVIAPAPNSCFATTGVSIGCRAAASKTSSMLAP